MLRRSGPIIWTNVSNDVDVPCVKSRDKMLSPVSPIMKRKAINLYES